MTIRSWGRLPVAPHEVVDLDRRETIPGILANNRPGIAFGAGRSYGDACLNPGGILWRTRRLDRFIDFDEASGLLRCEAGVLLRDIQRLFLPRGWSLPVTPGTQIVTVGGAIANDVHGKNHHGAGSFGHHVAQLTLARSDGGVVDCGPGHHADLFHATIGGLGLTGVIMSAAVRMSRVPGPWLKAETIPFRSLDAFFELSAASEDRWTHTVSWVDCLSGPDPRGLFMRASPIASEAPSPAPRERRMPFVPPVSLVNRATLSGFNALYYRLGQWRSGSRVEHVEKHLYPLDGLLDWNRMYGPRGFYQYQCVIPVEHARPGSRALLGEIQRSGKGSFLAVLKTFGTRESIGMLSFAMPGVTLALDFPNEGSDTLALLERLDGIVHGAGGRVYLAKDARLPRDRFEAGYPRFRDFAAFRDPGISSGMSRRLMGN